jgi:hypothetical protein
MPIRLPFVSGFLSQEFGQNHDAILQKTRPWLGTGQTPGNEGAGPFAMRVASASAVCAHRARLVVYGLAKTGTAAGAGAGNTLGITEGIQVRWQLASGSGRLWASLPAGHHAAQLGAVTAGQNGNLVDGWEVAMFFNLPMFFLFVNFGKNCT